MCIAFSPLRPEFNLKAFRVGFMVDKVKPKKYFLRVLRFFPIIIIPPMLHTHIHVYFRYWDCRHIQYVTQKRYKNNKENKAKVAIRYGLDGPGIKSRWGQIFRTRRDRPTQTRYNGCWVSFPGDTCLLMKLALLPSWGAPSDDRRSVLWQKSESVSVIYI